MSENITYHTTTKETNQVLNVSIEARRDGKVLTETRGSVRRGDNGAWVVRVARCKVTQRMDHVEAVECCRVEVRNTVQRTVNRLFQRELDNDLRQRRYARAAELKASNSGRCALKRLIDEGYATVMRQEEALEEIDAEIFARVCEEIQ